MVMGLCFNTAEFYLNYTLSEETDVRRIIPKWQKWQSVL